MCLVLKRPNWWLYIIPFHISDNKTKSFKTFHKCPAQRVPDNDVKMLQYKETTYNSKHILPATKSIKTKVIAEAYLTSTAQRNDQYHRDKTHRSWTKQDQEQTTKNTDLTCKEKSGPSAPEGWAQYHERVKQYHVSVSIFVNRFRYYALVPLILNISRDFSVYF